MKYVPRVITFSPVLLSQRFFSEASEAEKLYGNELISLFIFDFPGEPELCDSSANQVSPKSTGSDTFIQSWTALQSCFDPQSTYHYCDLWLSVGHARSVFVEHLSACRVNSRLREEFSRAMFLSGLS